MKRNLIVLFFLFAGLSAFKNAAGQSQSLHKIITTDDYDDGFSLVRSADDGYLICGSTGAAATGRASVYAVKLDANGVYEWSTAFVTEGNSRINGAVEAPDGDFVLAGFTVSPAGNADALVLRLSPAGDLIFSRFYGSSQNPDYINGISRASTFSEGFVLAGEQGRSNGKTDAWIFRIDDDGDVVENYLEGGRENDGFQSVDVQSGFYVAAGFTASNSPDSGKIACRLRYYNFEFDEVGDYVFNEGNHCNIKRVAFIGDQAETGIAVEVQNHDSNYAFAAKYGRTSGRQWALRLDSANSAWNSLQRDGSFGGLWAGTVQNGAGNHQAAFQSVETFNGIADTLAVFDTPHNYIVRDVQVDANYVTMAGTRNKNGTSMGELFLVRTPKNGTFSNADSTLFIDDSFEIVLHADDLPKPLKSSDVKLYPNPARDFINIRRSGSNPAEIRILNTAGIAIKTVHIAGFDQNKQLDITALPAGNYLLQIIEKQGFDRISTVKLFTKQN